MLYEPRAFLKCQNKNGILPEVFKGDWTPLCKTSSLQSGFFLPVLLGDSTPWTSHGQSPWHFKLCEIPVCENGAPKIGRFCRDDDSPMGTMGYHGAPYFQSHSQRNPARPCRIVASPFRGILWIPTHRRPLLPLHTCSSLLSPGPKLHPSKFHIWSDIVPGFSAYQIHIVLCFKHITILFGRIAGGWTHTERRCAARTISGNIQKDLTKVQCTSYIYIYIYICIYIYIICIMIDHYTSLYRCTSLHIIIIH